MSFIGSLANPATRSAIHLRRLLRRPTSVGQMGGSEMSINFPRGKSDEVIDRIVEALQEYQADHPGRRIDLYRQNAVSVRVRIVDPEFAGRTRSSGARKSGNT